MILYANGCSFTSGFGATTVSDVIEMYNISWPKILGDKLGTTNVFNKAMPCASNYKIAVDTVEWINNYPGDKSDLFVVIGMTVPSRFMIELSNIYRLNVMPQIWGFPEARVLTRKDISPYDVPYGTQLMSDAEIEPLAGAYKANLVAELTKYGMVANPKVDYIYHGLAGFLQAHGIQYHIFNCMDQDTEHTIVPNLHLDTLWLTEDYVLHGVDTVHPSEEQHTEWANKLYNEYF